MRRSIYLAALLAALPFAVASTASAQSVKQEAKELRKAKHELNGDQRDRRQAVKAGDRSAVKQETREVRADKRDVKQERRDVKRAVKDKRNP
ncbi:hypothetical protein [Gemmatimonas groenlandica]|uniref:Uncharacterized protein n=1 Tax=Gemmatimonas groenlandica TaxID=2732249 RepID=A0A6M4IQ45_9BACT|nr:hypothetical protein [Gemmatimonas groenlandica]QJR35879.1 hypothetical protein HKW67_10330 [Gemmatimonas groenlandica]